MVTSRLHPVEHYFASSNSRNNTGRLFVLISGPLRRRRAHAMRFAPVELVDQQARANRKSWTETTFTIAPVAGPTVTSDTSQS